MTSTSGTDSATDAVRAIRSDFTLTSDTASGADAVRVLQALSAMELVNAVRAVTAERPDVKDILLAHWSQAAFEWNGTPVGQRPQHSQSGHSVASEGDPDSSPRINMLSQASERNSFRAVLRGKPGGWQQQTPATRIVECWSIVFLLVFNVVMFTSVFIAYWMSIGSGQVTAKQFYISSSIDTGMPHRIGDLGLSIAFMAYLYMQITRYIAVGALLEPLQEYLADRVTLLSKVALLFEVFAALGGLGVGAFNQSFNYAVHMTFAFITFSGAVSSLFVQTYIDELLSQHTVLGLPRIARKWRIFRWCCCIVGLFGLIGMFAFGSNGFIEESCGSELCMATACFGYYLTWLGSSGTGYIVGYDLFAYSRPAGASVFRLQSFAECGSPRSLRNSPSTVSIAS